MLTFGMIDKSIRNHQILASSTKLISTLDSFPWDARLNVPYGAWMAGAKDQHQWLQIDFERVMQVRKVATQGHPRYDFWIEKFKLQYSANNTVNGTRYDGSQWEGYQEDDGSHCTGCERNMTDRIFIANTDNNTIVRQYLAEFIFARYLRLIPVAWHEEIALRIEVYGCYFKDMKPEVVSVYNTTKLHFPYNGTIECRAFGVPLPTIRWIRDGFDYDGGVNATIISYIEDEFHVVSEIQFHPLYDDRGFYTCVAENVYGSDRMTFYNEKGLPYYTYGDKIICDTETLQITCPEGEYIRITHTAYGRFHNEKCVIWDDHYPTDCEYDPETVLYRMERQCNNKQHCMVDVDEVQFATTGVDYPICIGFPKYLNVSWDCVGTVWTDWFNQQNGTNKHREYEEYQTLKDNFEMQCADMLATECREASSGAPFYETGDTLTRACTSYLNGGLQCSKRYQQDSSNCHDYEVRFKCPEEYHGIGELEQALECAGQELAISCYPHNYIVVQEAFYGCAEEGLCSRHGAQSYDLNCAVNSTEVLNMVKTNCDNKQSCKLNVQMSVFDTPDTNGTLASVCPDVPMYLDVVYDCQSFRHIHTKAKPANQSSVSGSQDSSYGNDDLTSNTDCPSQCSITQQEWEPWYVVDMEREYLINAVDVITCSVEAERANMSNFEVRVGNSENFQDNNLCGNVTYDIEASNVIYCNGELRGRYVSVQDVDSNAALYLCDVSAYYMGHRQLTATSCDSQTMQLTCDDEYIWIDKVFYGREDTTGKICPHRFSNHTYSACETYSTSEEVVINKCHGNKACDINIQTDLWHILDANNADSCPNEYKYLQVSYSCEKFIEDNNTFETNAMACSEEILQIACSGANRFIEITSATWKAATNTTPHWCANENDNQDSKADRNVTDVVAMQCDNKKTCIVKAYHQMLGIDDFTTTTQRPYLDVNFICKADLPEGEITLFACDGESNEHELSLTCPDGMWINITDAFYGRTRHGDENVCPSSALRHSATDCRSNDTQAIIEAYCQGQRSCSVPVDSESLTASDPCEDIHKYLEVSYTCEETRPLGDLTLYACADHDDLSIECPASHPHVRIITADFGRQEGHMRCANREGVHSYATYPECFTPNVLDEARTRCTNSHNCTVPSYWQYYTNQEPCPGITKYLQVTYRCLMNIHDWKPCGGYSYFINPRPDLQNYGLHSNYEINQTWTRNILACQKDCMANDDCASFHFEKTRQKSGYKCSFNNMIYDEVPNDFISKSDTLYYQRESYREFD